MISVNIDISKAIAELGRVEANLSDLTPLTASVAELMREAADSEFVSEGASSGGWVPWSESYAILRQKTPGQILTVDGTLRRSIQNSAQSGADFATIGSNMPYAAIHQFGGAGDDPPIPARPYMVFTDSLKSEIEEMVEKWIGG